jgi:hypothetical protein
VKKSLPYLGAALATLVMTWSVQAKAQTFSDVPADHWAYQAVTDLQAKKILIGYPDGFFKGKRVLTRYEFAVALKRALDSIMGGTGTKGDPGPPGPPGEKGADGAPGPAGPPGMTPEEVQNLMRLTDMFKADLAALGADVRKINGRLDALAAAVDAINKRLDKMPQFGGEFFQGFRSDLSRYAFFDYSGAARVNAPGPGGFGGNQSLFDNVASPSDFHLTVKANLAGDVKFVGDIAASNYLSYVGSGIAGIGQLGGPSTANPNGGPTQFFLHQAELDIPLSQFGSNTMLTVGRFKNQITPLTYYRPDTDAYFNLPWYDDGNYVADGFKLSSKFGSATTQIFGNSYSSATTSSGGFINKPIIGATNGPREVLVGGVPALAVGKPIGINFQGQTVANQGAGIHVGLPLFKWGEAGFTLADFSTNTAAGGPFGNVVVYGGNVTLNPIGRIALSAEYAKSVTQVSFDTADGQSNDDNNAFNVHLGYMSHGLGIQAGYQYIDPRFGAPGYWDKIGNWYNPTNVQGPFVRLNYAFTDKLSGSLGGDFYSGARNRPGFTMGSTVARAEAGLRYHLNKTVNLGADYEGVFYDYSGAVTASGVRAKPVEQYITFSASANLSGNTVLKMAYQLLSALDVGGGWGGVAPAPATGIAGSTQSANVFTTQVAVHF